ncbi:transketolase [Pseudobutyrivibrio sp. ACV-2]|uniref:transketolase n=1 Tax=Pseudobutyrivibrio sp. ACV-2 TaxID=1520801 RepID=UPI0008983C91|nr:transketolase [Pseudobutyrivibrio sp. ACV-2]SEA52419.1 transketolase [Pseudobutyrivibrio sp. ACV-2]
MKKILNVNYDDLRATALKNRLKILNMVHDGASGHLGGALSACDIITYLGECIIDYDSDERDRFILSKGHAVTALYAELHELGIVKDEELHTFRKLNSRLSGHTNREKLPETDVTTGLLGQGLSYGVGMAFAKKLKKSRDTVYVMIGDGETHEGQIWEALMEAGHFKLDNLVLIIDRNGLCSHQPVENVISIEPLADRLESFGWFVKDINGHSMEEIDSAITSLQSQYGKPKCIIAHTVKGKGISFMENDGQWHRNIPTDEQYEIAKAELEAQIGGTNV